jgi:hypothetical protein
MLKKEKLLKISRILNQNIPLIENLEKSKNSDLFAPVFYESGINLLLSKHNKKSHFTTKAKHLNSKMIKGAKNITAQFEEFGISEYIKTFEPCISKISELSLFLNLLPEKENILEIISTANEQFSQESLNFYNSFLVDAFNFGKMHGEQFGSKKTAKGALEKYAFTLDDSQKFNLTVNYLHSQVELEVKKLTAALEASVNKNYNSERDHKTLINNLQKIYSDFSINVEEMLRKHAWQCYSVGNLHQLKKDKVEFISWKTSHQLNDCIFCRGIETGDIVLCNTFNQILEHRRNIDQVSYPIDVIIKLCELEGPSYFGHDDCRCFWVASK